MDTLSEFIHEDYVNSLKGVLLEAANSAYEHVREFAEDFVLPLYLYACHEAYMEPDEELIKSYRSNKRV